MDIVIKVSTVCESLYSWCLLSKHLTVARMDGHRNRINIMDCINIICVIEYIIRVMYVIQAGHRDRTNITSVIDDRLRVRYGIRVMCLDIGLTRSVSSG